MVRRTARARGKSGWKGGDVHSPSSATGETLCSRCRAQSIGVEPFSCGKVDDPRPVALTWGGAGVDHTPPPHPTVGTPDLDTTLPSRLPKFLSEGMH